MLPTEQVVCDVNVSKGRAFNRNMTCALMQWNVQNLKISQKPKKKVGLILNCIKIVPNKKRTRTVIIAFLNNLLYPLENSIERSDDPT